VADARSKAALWTGLGNLINRLGNSELAATASTQRKGKGLWSGLEVRPAVLRVGEKHQVRRVAYLGLDSSGAPLYDLCYFYYSYGYSDTQDPNCDNTGYVQVGDYFTFQDSVWDPEFNYAWVLPSLWATSFYNSAYVGGNRFYDTVAFVLYQNAYLNFAYSPFFEVATWDYGYSSGVVFGSNYY
jgi:hypothetical protein